MGLQENPTPKGVQLMMLTDANSHHTRPGQAARAPCQDTMVLPRPGLRLTKATPGSAPQVCLLEAGGGLLSGGMSQGHAHRG
jgi:hypothetical protein